MMRMHLTCVRMACICSGMDGNAITLGLDIEDAALTAWEDAFALFCLDPLLGAPDCYGEFLQWAKRRDVGLVGDYVPTEPSALEPEAYAAWETWRRVSCWRP